MEFLLFFALILLLAGSSLLWGVDSRDTVNSNEWHRRQAASNQQYRIK